MNESVRDEQATAQEVNESGSEKGVLSNGKARVRAPKVDYPFKRMTVGETVSYDGPVRTYKDALRQYTRYNTGKTFRAEKTPTGVRVTRTA